MEKLLKLLNEYLWQTNIVVIEQEIEWRRDIFFENEDWFHAEEAEIISKKFWFIQWLVDNDRTLPINPLHGYSKTNRVIITLAVKDDPISFLVSVLK